MARSAARGQISRATMASDPRSELHEFGYADVRELLPPTRKIRRRPMHFAPSARHLSPN
jgi:hypothetical protein